MPTPRTLSTLEEKDLSYNRWEYDLETIGQKVTGSTTTLWRLEHTRKTIRSSQRHKPLTDHSYHDQLNEGSPDIIELLPKDSDTEGQHPKSTRLDTQPLHLNLSLAEENGYREILGAIDYARESDRLYGANTLRKRPGGFPGSGKISPPTPGKRKYPRERRMMIWDPEKEWGPERERKLTLSYNPKWTRKSWHGSKWIGNETYRKTYVRAKSEQERQQHIPLKFGDNSTIEDGLS